MEQLEERVHNVELKICEIETKMPLFEDLIKRSVESQEAMSGAVCSLEKTLIKMDNKIDAQGTKIDKQGQDIKTLTDKVNAVEDECKIDFIAWLKKNWYWIVILLGVGIFELSKYFKF